MAPANFLRLLAIFSLALLNISFSTLPANALAVERGHIARGINHAHAGVAKKRGDSSKQCKPRPSAPSSSNPDPTTPAPVSQPSPNTSPTSSSQSSEPSSTPSSGGSSGRGKLELMWSNEEESSFCNFLTKSVVYYANWESTKSPYIGNCQGIDNVIFVATIHSPSNIPEIDLVVNNGYTILKFFNEGEISTQANVDATYAATLWEQHVKPLVNTGITFIAPSVTLSPHGLDWLKTFMAACNDCPFHAIDLHGYSIDPQEIITAISNFHDIFQMTVWVSELGCTDYSGANRYCTDDLFSIFFAAMQSFCEQAEYIEAYGFFSMFRLDEMPDGVTGSNHMIDCPQNQPGPSCYPNQNGQKFLNP